MWGLLGELAERAQLEHLDVAARQHYTFRYERLRYATVPPEVVCRLVGGCATLRTLCLGESSTRQYGVDELATFADVASSSRHEPLEIRVMCASDPSRLETAAAASGAGSGSSRGVRFIAVDESGESRVQKATKFGHLRTAVMEGLPTLAARRPQDRD